MVNITLYRIRISHNHENLYGAWKYRSASILGHQIMLKLWRLWFTEKEKKQFSIFRYGVFDYKNRTVNGLTVHLPNRSIRLLTILPAILWRWQIAAGIVFLQFKYYRWDVIDFHSVKLKTCCAAWRVKCLNFPFPIQ